MFFCKCQWPSRFQLPLRDLLLSFLGNMHLRRSPFPVSICGDLLHLDRKPCFPIFFFLYCLIPIEIHTLCFFSHCYLLLLSPSLQLICLALLCEVGLALREPIGCFVGWSGMCTASSLTLEGARGFHVKMEGTERLGDAGFAWAF